MQECDSEVMNLCHELNLLVVFGDDAGDAVLDEVHLFTRSSLTDDVIIGLEHLELELTQHSCHKVGVSVGE